MVKQKTFMEILKEASEAKMDLRLLDEISVSRKQLKEVYVAVLEDIRSFNLCTLISSQENIAFLVDTSSDDKILAFLDSCEKLEKKLDLIIEMTEEIIQSASLMCRADSKSISINITSEMVAIKDKATGYQTRIKRLREVYSRYIQSTEEI